MSEAPVLLHNFKLKGEQITVFRSNVSNVGRRVYNGENLKVDRKKAYQGQQTKQSVKRISECLYSWMYAISEGNKKFGLVGTRKEIKPIMLTLTLSAKQFHTDKEIKAQILEPFLKYLKNNYSIENYFWRAEPQENGNIHFHLVTDKYIPRQIITEKWNFYQNKLGYIDKYFELTKKTNPPSTQVQLFSGNEKAIGYLLKYVLKKNERRTIEGLQMRVSNKLSHFKIQNIEVEFSRVNEILDLLEKNAKRTYKNDWSITYYFDFDVHSWLKNHDVLSRSRVYYGKLFESVYVCKLDSWEVNLVSFYYNNRFKFESMMRTFERLSIDVERVKEILRITR